MKHTYVNPSGPPSATMAICGEQPGTMEVRANPPRPFVGPAGQGLNECLQMTKICSLLTNSFYLTKIHLF